MMSAVGGGGGPCGPASVRKGDFVYFPWLCASHLELAGHKLPAHRSETLCGLVVVSGDFVGPPLGVALARRPGGPSQGFSKRFS